MAKKRRKSRTYRKQRTRLSFYGGLILMMGFFSVALIAFYLWGKVQIDFVLRENQRLDRKKKSVERVVDDLHIQVDALKRYQRIVELAKEQGMEFLSASQLDELTVDLNDVNDHRRIEDSDVRYAGFVWLNHRPKRVKK
jgi:cell division protein FtsL